MKNNKRIMVLLSITLCLSIGLGACGKKTETKSDGTQTGNEETEYSDTLNIAMTAQPPTLDAPVSASNAVSDVAGNIYEQLFTLNENYEPTPDLAESVDISDDGLEYTFTLRQGVLFHNGKEMKADDVAASMNRWLEVSSRAKSLLPNSSFEKVDDYTVKYTVETATSDVMQILASRTLFATIMPEEIAKNTDPEGVTEYIGTGPYKLEEWKQDQYIHLVRYEDYQSPDSEPSAYSGRKEAATEHIYYHFVEDAATRIAGVKTGEYDVAETVPLENYEELNTADGVTTYTRAAGSLNVWFNTTEGIVSNLEIRQALLAAINCEEIMLASYSDKDYFTLDPGYMNIEQAQWAVDNGSEYYNQADPQKAEGLLKAAGYNGETITLLTTKDYQEMYSGTIVLQDQLRKIGVNAEVANYDFSTFMEKKGGTGNWDIFITSNSYNAIPAQILAVDPGWAGFDEPEVAEALAAIRGADSDEAAKEEWGKLQQFMYEFASSSALGHYNAAMASTDKVEGLVYFDHPIYWNVKVVK